MKNLNITQETREILNLIDGLQTHFRAITRALYNRGYEDKDLNQFFEAYDKMRLIELDFLTKSISSQLEEPAEEGTLSI